MKRLLLIVLLVAGGLAAGAYYRQRLAAKRRDPDPAGMETVHPQRRRVRSQVNATGTLRLRTGAEVRAGAQISGIVTKLNVSVGSHVERGEVIAVIDSRGLDARIEDARMQIEVDEAALRKVQRDTDRTRKLVEGGLTPRLQLEDLEEDLRSAEARVAKSRSSLKIVESDLPYLEIHAPIAGTVASVSTLQGETVAASLAAPTFVTIIADDALELVAMVDETDIGGVRVGERVAFTTETYPGRDFQGAVERIAPKATIVSGVVNYEVGVKLSGPASALKPDMTANVNIETAARETLVIPHSAVAHEADADFVYVKTAGAPEKRRVAIGARDGAWDEIRSGLKPEDLLLTRPPVKEKE